MSEPGWASCTWGGVPSGKSRPQERLCYSGFDPNEDHDIPVDIASGTIKGNTLRYIDGLHVVLDILPCLSMVV